MIGETPIDKGNESARIDGVPRATSAVSDAHGPEAAAPVAVPRPLGGRRISFAVWGLAGVAGIGLWVLLFKLI